MNKSKKETVYDTIERIKEKGVIYEKIKNFKKIRGEKIKSIEEEYQKYIDDTVYQSLPFRVGDIITDVLNCRERYFIYKGIKEEFMILHSCDKDGNEDNRENRRYRWITCEDFILYKR